MSDVYTPRLKRSWFALQFDAASATADLYLYDKIGMDGVGANDLAEQLLAVNASRLNVRIDSSGGSLEEGMRVYRTIKAFKGEKVVYVDGLAASIASVIAMAGDRIVISPSSFFFVHKPWTSTEGNANDLQHTAEQLDQLEATLVAVYCEKTGQSAATISAMLNDERLIGATEAVELNFAQSVAQINSTERGVVMAKVLCHMAKRFEKENAAMETPEQIAEREAKEKADAEAAAAAEKDAADAKAKADAEAAAAEEAAKAAAAATQPDARADFVAFAERFGDVRAAAYFKAGLLFADAERRFCDELIAENQALKASAAVPPGPAPVGPAPVKALADGGPRDWKAALALHGEDYVKARRAHPDLYDLFMQSTK
jgi:ATP-dependent protease ClpP protease subunit